MAKQTLKSLYPETHLTAPLSQAEAADVLNCMVDDFCFGGDGYPWGSYQYADLAELVRDGNKVAAKAFLKAMPPVIRNEIPVEVLAVIGR